MFGRQNTITCPAGQWTTVIQTSFAQIPVAWTLRFQGEGDAIIGEYEETKSAWVFPGTPSTGPIQAQMRFARGYWNTFYKVRIRPVDSITVALESELA